MTDTIESFIADHVRKLEPLNTACAEASWGLATTGEKRFAAEVERLSTEIRRLYGSPEDFTRLTKLPASSSALTARQQNLLQWAYQGCQFSPSHIQEMVSREVWIETQFATFRPQFNGSPASENVLRDVLRSETNSPKREAAWKAGKEIGALVETKTLELVRIRNQAAREAGFPDFYRMQLTLNELQEERLFTILAELERVTQPLWDVYKARLDERLAERYGIRISEMAPWHYEDPFFQEPPAEKEDLDGLYAKSDVVQISRAFFADTGLPVDDILARSDLFERPGKNQHAQCTCIDRKQDVRILCNLRPTEKWMGTQLHELGHAVYDKWLDPELPYLLRQPTHILMTEAIAMLFGRLSKDPEFLERYVGVDASTARRVGAVCARQKAATLLVFARWVLVMTHFERALYQEPERDLRSFWWECVSRFQGVRPPQGRHAPDWASKIHLPCSPVYYQNYILGEMVASQLLATMRATFASSAAASSLVGAPHVGSFLRERLFSLGARYPWEDTLKKVTGAGLQAKAFVADLQPILAVS